MSGIASLFGGNSAKGDRNDELQARTNEGNIFNYALPQGQQESTSGSDLSGEAGDSFSRALTAGRAETAQSAEPALNANISAGDAAKRREALTGTGRTGGTAEADRVAQAGTDANADNIINQTQQAQKQAGATGAAGVVSQLENAGLGEQNVAQTTQANLLNNTLDAQKQDQQIHNSDFDRVGGDVGQAVAGLFF